MSRKKTESKAPWEKIRFFLKGDKLKGNKANINNSKLRSKVGLRKDKRERKP